MVTGFAGNAGLAIMTNDPSAMTRYVEGGDFATDIAVGAAMGGGVGFAKAGEADKTAWHNQGIPGKIKTGSKEIWKTYLKPFKPVYSGYKTYDDFIKREQESQNESDNNH